MASSQKGKVDLKVVLLGASQIGKTCLVDRFLNDRFSTKSEATVGGVFQAKTVTRGGRSITLGVWDTAGSERYKSMTSVYYRSSHAAVVCYDLTSAGTVERVKFWVDQLRQFEPDCFVVIVGTKYDLVQSGASQRDVSAREIEEYAASIGAPQFVTSAKSGDGVAAPFECIADKFLSEPAKTEGRYDKFQAGQPSAQQKGAKGGCCGN